MALWLLPPIGAIIGSAIYSEYPTELPIISVTYIEVSGQTLSTSGDKVLTLYDPIIITKATYGWNDVLNTYDITKKIQFLIKEKSGKIEFDVSNFGKLPYFSKTKAGIGGLAGLGLAILIMRIDTSKPPS
jgi:hypothetical protein